MNFFNIVHGVVSQIQSLYKRISDGLLIYTLNKDTEIVQLYNDDNYYISNSIDGKLRIPQPSRAYNFTGIENVSVPAKTFTGNTYTSAFWHSQAGLDLWGQVIIHDGLNTTPLSVLIGHSNHQLRVYKSGGAVGVLIPDAFTDNDFARFVITFDGLTCNVYKNTNLIGTFDDAAISLGSVVTSMGIGNTFDNIPFKISKIQESNSVWSKQDIMDDYNGAIITKGSADNFLFQCDEDAALVSYDSTKVNGNNGTINLSGSTESSFHIETNEVPSIQNEIGYNSLWIVNEGDYEALFGDVAVDDSLEFSIKTIDTNCSLIGQQNTSVYRIMHWVQGDGGQPWSTNNETYIDTILFTGTRDDLYNLVADGVLHNCKVIYKSPVVDVSMFNFNGVTPSASKFTGQCTDIIHKNSNGDIIQVLEGNQKIPIAQSIYNINDDFLTMQPWADPTVPNGWTKVGTHDANSFVEENANGLRLYSSTNFIGIQISNILNLGTTYEIVVDVHSVADGGATINNINHIFDAGIHIFQYVAILTHIQIKRATGTGDDVVIRSIKVKQTNAVLGQTDVLGNIVPYEYYDQVKYPIKLGNSSVANFDGIIDGSLGVHPEYRVENVRFTNVFDGTNNDNVIILSGIDGNAYFGAGKQKGWCHSVLNNTKEFIIRSHDLDLTIDISSNFNAYGYNKIIFESYNKQIIVNVNGVELYNVNHPEIIYQWEDHGSFVNGYNYSSGGSLNILQSADKRHFFKYEELDTSGNTINELINLNLSETNGSTSFNTAINRPTGNTDMTYILNGSSDGTQWSNSDKQYPYNFANGFTKAGYFGDVRVLDLGKHSEFEIQNFEVELKVKIVKDSATRSIFGYVNELGPTDGYGFKIRKNTVDIISFQCWGGIGVYAGMSGAYTPIDGEILTINVKLYNGIGYMNVNGSENQKTMVTLAYDSIAKLLVGASQYNGVVTYKYNDLILYVKYYSLDSGGTRTAELLNVDIKNGDITSISNIATDAPINSDAIWLPVNDGKYTYIPADPSNLGYDITGGDLSFTGNTTSLKPTENLIDRNPFDVYDMVQAGVPTTEDISYEDITNNNNIGRIYENSDDEVNKLMVYEDDAFEELMQGGVYNFSGLESITVSATTFTDNLYTCAFWISVESLLTWCNIILHPDYTTGIGVIIGQSNREVRVYVNAGGSPIQVPDAYELSEWNRFVVTYDGATCNLYKNTILIGTLDRVTVLPTVNTIIGKSVLLNDQPFKTAKIQESNSVWTEQDIIDDFNGKLITKGSVDNFLFTGIEGGGATAYDALRIYGNNGVIEYSGATESEFFEKIEYYPHQLLYGKTTVGYFNQSRYLDLGKHSEFEIQDFEVELKIIADHTGISSVLFGNASVDTVTPAWSGWDIIKLSDERIIFDMFDGVSSNDIIASTYSSIDGESLVINFKYYNGTAYFDVNGVTNNKVMAYTPSYTAEVEQLIGAEIVNGNPTSKHIGYISSVKFWQLDSGGTRTGNILVTDFKNGTDTLVPNIAVDAPVGSDGIWSPDSGYIDIPAVTNYYGFDVNEGDIEATIGTVSSGDTLEFSIKTTQDKCVLLYTSDNAGWYAFVWQDGSVAATENLWAASYVIDGNSFTGNRDELHTLLTDGLLHKVKITSLEAMSNALMFDNTINTTWKLTGQTTKIIHKDSNGNVINIIQGNIEETGNISEPKLNVVGTLIDNEEVVTKYNNINKFVNR